jgi:hypothetical protein
VDVFPDGDASLLFLNRTEHLRSELIEVEKLGIV